MEEELLTTYEEKKEYPEKEYGDCPDWIKEKHGGKCPPDWREKYGYNKKLEEVASPAKDTKEQKEQIAQLEKELSSKKEEIEKLKQKIVELEAQLLAQKEESSKLEDFVKKILIERIQKFNSEIPKLEEKTSAELFEVLTELEKREVRENIEKLAPNADLSMLDDFDLDSLKKFESILSKSLANLPEIQPKKSVPSEEETLSRKPTYTTEGVIQYLRSIKK